MAFLTGKATSDRLESMAPEGMSLRIPPACLLDMQGEPLEYEESVSLTVSFPASPRYANPLGHMQGGYIVAALDNTLGPFSYLIAPPSLTSSLNTQYLRPVTPETGFITCVARFAERTRAKLLTDRRSAQSKRQGRGPVPSGLPDPVREKLKS